MAELVDASGPNACVASGWLHMRMPSMHAQHSPPCVCRVYSFSRLECVVTLALSGRRVGGGNASMCAPGAVLGSQVGVAFYVMAAGVLVAWSLQLHAVFQKCVL